MKQIGYIRGCEGYGLFEPEAGDRIVLVAGDYPFIEVSTDGEVVCRTDRLNSGACGGVPVLGDIGDASRRVGTAAFVVSPHWVAALFDAIQRGPEKGRERIEIAPIADLDEAVAIIRGVVPKYRFLPPCNAWGVPGYERGPERWVLF